MKLEEHPFVQSISDDRRASILEEIEVLDLKREEVIFQEQSDPDAIYLVLSGTVVFTKAKIDGTYQHISEADEGSFFGEVGVFTGEKRALGAISMEDSRIGKIAEPTVKRIIEDSEPVRKILESVIFHLKSTTAHYMNDVMRTEKLALVGTMVSSILHDFKNPFSIISLGSTIVQKRHADDPKTIKICDNIESQIRRMVHMANDLASFSRGHHELDVVPVSVDQLFDVFQELNSPFFKDDRVELSLIGNGVELEGDTTKLLRVLQNLVSNAIDALHAAGIEGRIEARASEDGDFVVITISDNGPGIPEAIRDNFFEPFVSVGKKDGTGLGTAIAKSIVDAHRGTIRFDTSSKGTTFTIRLPKSQTLR
jgi:signal transduction histidine kinase